jgi:hypothetical protein
MIREPSRGEEQGVEVARGMQFLKWSRYRGMHLNQIACTCDNEWEEQFVASVMLVSTAQNEMMFGIPFSDVRDARSKMLISLTSTMCRRVGYLIGTI